MSCFFAAVAAQEKERERSDYEKEYDRHCDRQGTDASFCVGGINTAADIAICIHRHLTQCGSVQRKVLPCVYGGCV